MHAMPQQESITDLLLATCIINLYDHQYLLEESMGAKGLQRRQENMLLKLPKNSLTPGICRRLAQYLGDSAVQFAIIKSAQRETYIESVFTMCLGAAKDLFTVAGVQRIPISLMATKETRVRRAHHAAWQCILINGGNHAQIHQLCSPARHTSCCLTARALYETQNNCRLMAALR